MITIPDAPPIEKWKPAAPALHFFIEGEPSTDHRPRCRCSKNKPRARLSTEFRAWKDTCRQATRVALVSYILEHGHAWPTGDAWRYVVRCFALTSVGKKDADNAGRGFRDAVEGLLWKSDHRCRPVIDDIAKLPEGEPRPPGLLVEVRPYRHRRVVADVSIQLHMGGSNE